MVSHLPEVEFITWINDKRRETEREKRESSELNSLSPSVLLQCQESLDRADTAWAKVKVNRQTERENEKRRKQLGRKQRKQKRSGHLKPWLSYGTDSWQMFSLIALSWQRYTSKRIKCKVVQEKALLVKERMYSVMRQKLAARMSKKRWRQRGQELLCLTWAISAACTLCLYESIMSHWL